MFSNWNMWELGFLSNIINDDKIEEEKMMLERAKALGDMSIYENYINQKGKAGISSVDDFGGFGGPWVAHYKNRSEIENEKMMLERAKALGDMSIYENYVRQKEYRKKSSLSYDTKVGIALIVIAIIAVLFVVVLLKV